MKFKAAGLQEKGDSQEDMAKSERRRTIGWRIRAARDKVGVTQSELATQIGLKRAAIAQWERNESTPSLSTIEDVAKFLNMPAEFLAFGISGEPQKVMPDPEELGYVLVPEVEFGESPGNRREVRKWGLPTDWLRSELNVVSTEKLILFRALVGDVNQEVGDRVIVDCSATRPSPPGQFLQWDGIGPVISHVAVVPIGGPKSMMARVSGTNGTHDVPIGELQIIGRVRGAWRKM